MSNTFNNTEKFSLNRLKPFAVLWIGIAERNLKINRNSKLRSIHVKSNSLDEVEKNEGALFTNFPMP